jgi:transposase
MCGVDLTRIDRTEAQPPCRCLGDRRGHAALPERQALHLPGTRIAGGKVMGTDQAGRQPRRTGFRRLCSRMDKPKAVTAAAHKIARLVYINADSRPGYTDQGQDYYEVRYRERVLLALWQRAPKVGMKMVAIEQPARRLAFTEQGLTESERLFGDLFGVGSN